ncbi:MAG: LysR family transcriptional regulator [Oscillospiraceae bacterium]|nr:LysR family transcriptional regulator [Oscillospiraceae bacterium]
MVFQQLRYFVMVAESGSINRAAERLFISQQSLRASVNSLEEKLGFALFYRSSRGTRLTEAGEAVLEDARRILAVADSWSRFAGQDLSEPVTVQVVASPLVYNTVLTDLVVECRASYPNLRLTIYCARVDELLEQMSQRAIGVLGSAPEEEIRQRLQPFAQRRQLALETFAQDKFCVYLNRSNPLASQPWLTTDQLGQLILAAYPEEDRRFFYRAIYQYFSPAAPYFLGKIENIFQLIAEMPDVAAVFPHMAVLNNIHVQRGQIFALPVRDFPMPAIGCMLSPEPGSMTRAEKFVASLIRQRFLALPGKMEAVNAGGESKRAP